MKKIKLRLLFFLIAIQFSACAQKKTPVQSTETKSDDTIFKTESEWKKILTEEEYYILREKGTEKPYTGKFLFHKEKGNYTCKACGNILFASNAKFDSHCGWPSFDQQIAEGSIKTQEDHSLGMERTEILCAKCGGHLGHVFHDGPTQTGLRYCVNSVSLDFIAADSLKSKKKPGLEKITLGGGCFWCIEAAFENIKGIEKVQSGYAGGNTKNPSYEEICEGNTGHAEVVQLTYDSSIISIEEILRIFFTVHDPTTLNYQGADVGTQYRSVIFYHTKRQKDISENIINKLTNEKVFDNKIVTQILPFTNYYPAEKYHQEYYSNNKNKPYCKAVIAPKLEKLKKVFPDKLKK